MLIRNKNNNAQHHSKINVEIWLWFLGIYEKEHRENGSRTNEFSV